MNILKVFSLVNVLTETTDNILNIELFNDGSLKGQLFIYFDDWRKTMQAVVDHREGGFPLTSESGRNRIDIDLRFPEEQK